LVVAFLETIRRATYSRDQGWPPVAFVLDEVANIAPLPGLPALVSEGGGQGLVTLACLQDLSQARARWGTAAEGFLTLFGAKVVLPGIADLRTLQLVSALAGDHDVRMRSLTRSSSGLNFSTSTTTYAQRQAVWPVDQVAQIRSGTALAMWPGTPPLQIRLTPAWAEPWSGVLERASRTVS
jgi:type IV secretion system protein VirD4